MKIEIIATDQITDIDGVQVRVWEGKTESGIPCYVFIHRVAVRADLDCSTFDKELKEQMPPGRVVPLRNIL